MIGMHVTTAAGWDALPAEVTHLRLWDVGVTWRDIHVGPDSYNWTRLDSLVDKAGGRHLTYVIAATPAWLAKYPENPHAAPWLGKGSNSMPWSVEEFNKFVWNLATRYKGRIRAYEVWNEPQLADFLYPYTDAECNTLATMTKRAYRTIKECDPDALVLAASVLPRDSSGGMKRAGRYLSALARKDWPVDAFTCHIYPEPGTWGPRWRTMLDDVIAGLKARSAPTSRIWITETAFGLLAPAITDAEAIDKAVRAVYDAAGKRFVHWYAWDRPDLGGPLIAGHTAAWSSIKTHHLTGAAA
jgi:hypothetical protein